MNTPEASSETDALMELARLATKAKTFLPTPSLKALYKAAKDGERRADKKNRLTTAFRLVFVEG